jgi:hypothetical protein
MLLYASTNNREMQHEKAAESLAFCGFFVRFLEEGTIKLGRMNGNKLKMQNCSGNHRMNVIRFPIQPVD